MKKECIVDGCQLPSEKRDMCGKHYRRWQRHGDPMITKKRANGTCSVYIDKNGYLRIQSKKDVILLHRAVMEAYLGRKLRDDEIVHHINEDRLDNHPRNLQIMSRGEHISHHHIDVSDHGMNTEHEKFCPKCQTVKPISQFYADKKVGTRAYCKPCCAEKSREDRDKINAARRKRRHLSRLAKKSESSS